MISDKINLRMLEEKALPVMKRLRNRLKQSVALVILDAATGNGVTVAKEEHTTGVAVRFEVNFQFPAHVAAPTKAILAAMPESESMEIIDRFDFRKFTDHSISGKAAFVKELDVVRGCGYAVDRGEYLLGVHCVAAAILDGASYPVGAIVTSSFSSILTEDDFERVAKHVIKASNEISSTLSNKSRGNDSYAKLVIEQAADYFEKNMDVNLDVRKYAEDRNIKYSWFRAKFSEVMDISPKQYHLNLKMQKAKELLLETDLPIKEIALSLGYENQNNFSNMFKKRVGVFPSKHRVSDSKSWD